MGESKAYWIAFHRVSGVGAVRFRALLRAFGTLEQAWQATDGELAQVGLGPSTLASLLAARERLDPLLEFQRIAQSGFSVLTWEDEAYPRRLKETDQAPPVLFLSGAIERADENAIAMVGTRIPTAYGLEAAEEFSRGFVDAGVTVVSGLARGIDARAHEAALQAGGRTLAVLGSGLDQIYPWEHKPLAAEIRDHGAVISDYPLGTPPDPRNFPPRNRLISGLAMAVVVVEAGEESGALLTAEFASQQARPVFSVPGNIHSRKSQGTNDLIAAGARPALSPEGVLAELGFRAGQAREPVRENAPADEQESLIWEVLGEGPMQADDLARRCGLPAAKVATALAMLELSGRVKAFGGSRFGRVRMTSGRV